MNALFPRMLFACLLFVSSITTAFAEGAKLNVYAWAGEIPESVISAFEKETGITVNFTTYDSNEMLYAKLKTNPSDYDLIQPSTHYVERMRKEDMLQTLDHSKLSHFANLDPLFQNPSYDPHAQYSIAHIWSATGIFVNDRYYNPQQFTHWSDLWRARLKDRLLLVNDVREVFSMVLLSLHYSANEQDPQKIKSAYQRLLQLAPNIKIFAVDAIPSIITDEDATIGIVWNGDLNQARKSNPHLHFIYPQEGFVLAADCFAIPKHAPHPDNALKFINFLLQKEIGKQVTEETGWATTNLAGRALLPQAVRNDSVIFPDAATIQRGSFHQDVNNNTVTLYEQYWEAFKLAL